MCTVMICNFFLSFIYEKNWSNFLSNAGKDSKIFILLANLRLNSAISLTIIWKYKPFFNNWSINLIESNLFLSLGGGKISLGGGKVTLGGGSCPLQPSPNDAPVFKLLLNLLNWTQIFLLLVCTL